MKKLLTHNPLFVVFFTVFIDLLGFGILLPVIPLLLGDPRSPYFLLAQGTSISSGYILLGFLTGIFLLMQFLAAPILGQLSDRFGRKPILIFSLIGTCLSYIIFAIGILTKNIVVLFLARALDGITGGNISVAQAAIADITTPENRAKNFGLIGAAFGLGFILGPYVGGKLSDPNVFHWFNAATPFWFAAVLSALNIVSVVMLFPETHLIRVRDRAIRWAQSIRNILKAFRMRTLRGLFATTFLFQGGFTFYTTFFSLFLINKFHYTQGNVGDFFSYVGIWIAFTQAVITRTLSRFLREKQILQITLFTAGMSIALLLLPSHAIGLFFLVPFLAISNGLTNANLSGLISRSAHASIQGEVLGLNASVQALAQSIPPILSGYIAASLSAEAPVIVSSIVIIFSGIVFALFVSRKR